MWEQRYSELVAYEQLNGHANVPVGHGVDYNPLATCLFSQRVRFRDGTLLEERLNKLRLLSCFRFDTVKTLDVRASWDERYYSWSSSETTVVLMCLYHFGK